MDVTFESVYETLVCDHSNESYWCCLILQNDLILILQNEIQDAFLSFELSTLGSERVCFFGGGGGLIFRTL